MFLSVEAHCNNATLHIFMNTYVSNSEIKNASLKLIFFLSLQIRNIRQSDSDIKANLCQKFLNEEPLQVLFTFKKMKYDEVEECKFWQSTVGKNQVILRHPIIHFPTSSGRSEQASKQMSATERASEAIWAEQAKE